MVAASVGSPLVDVIIPVHAATRPIRRAAASVLDGTVAPVRVSVIAHNIDPAIIEANLGDLMRDPRLRLLVLSDGIPSPAGPMNLGLDSVTAPFFALLGSDDEFAPGAVDAWLSLQRETGASVVIAAIQLVTGKRDPYPPTRNGRRTRDLHPRKDRLHYRSAPLGLLSTARHGHLRFAAGLASGEDLAYSCELWTTGAHIAYALTLPPYVGHDDAGDRVTGAARSVSADFAFLDGIEAIRGYRVLSGADRTAIVVKILRLHLFDAARAAVRWPSEFDSARRELVVVIDRLARMAPGALRLLSRADHQVIAALRAGDVDATGIATLIDRRQNYRSFSAIIPQHAWMLFAPQAPLRTLFAGVVSLSAH